MCVCVRPSQYVSRPGSGGERELPGRPSYTEPASSSTETALGSACFLQEIRCWIGHQVITVFSDYTLQNIRKKHLYEHYSCITISVLYYKGNICLYIYICIYAYKFSINVGVAPVSP